MIPTILSIAGSDPTGGAGIQADLKTATAIGVYCAAAITCITVQNSLGVTRVEPLAPDLVAAQVKAVLEDHAVSHIKIGMIGAAPIVESLADLLENFPGMVVYDPVLASTTGQSLLEQKAFRALSERLLPRITILTPNLPELAALSLQPVESGEQALAAAKRLLARYPAMKAVIVKGGHAAEGDFLTDYLLLRDAENLEILSHKHERIQSRNTHGTGCTMATAFASFHLLSGNMRQAFRDAASFMEVVIRKSGDRQVIVAADRTGPLVHCTWPDR